MPQRSLEQRLKIYDRVLGTVSAAALVIGGLFSVYTYLGDQRIKEEAERKLREKEIAQAQQELGVRKKELALALFREKREAYLALTDAACTIAGCRTYDEVERASREFLRLYYGRAHLIADGDGEVYRAKIAFRRALTEYLRDKPATSPDDYFEEFALAITDACKAHLDLRAIEGEAGPAPAGGFDKT